VQCRGGGGQYPTPGGGPHGIDGPPDACPHGGGHVGGCPPPGDPPYGVAVGWRPLNEVPCKQNL
jgi:hypothetical protein